MNAQLLKPIKAPNEQIPFSDPRIKYPMLASIKYDGYRGLLINGEFRSPMMKMFGNKDMQSYFHGLVSIANYHHLVFDGEVWHPNISFTDLGGRLRSHQGDLTGVEYHIFDILYVDDWNDGTEAPYAQRLGMLKTLFDDYGMRHCKLVAQNMCISHVGAEGLYAGALASGHEGLMLRSPRGPYKHNRCTHLESNLYKFKHFITNDAKITGVIQRRKMRSDIDRTFDPIGGLAKVHEQEAYELDEAVGAFEATLEDGSITALNLGRGFTYDDRRKIWSIRESYLGRHVEFKFMPHGTKNLPRIGSITRFRPDLD